MNKTKRAIRLIAAAPLLAGALLATGLDSGSEPRLPLVRRDLIRTAAPEFPKISRDLFSTVPFTGGEEGFAAGPWSPGSGRPGAPRNEEPALPPPPAVRYVGFIRNLTGKTITAIVLIDDKAWAVSEGELFAFGWSALKVTDKEIEMQNPLGEKLVFLYEGERP
jgi:hypothetical protein